MPKFSVILPAAGRSSRFAQPMGRKKVFMELAGRPVWVRAIEPFLNRDDVIQTLVVVGPDDLEWFKEKFQANLMFMNVEVVAGGAERVDSVQNALARVSAEADFVAVHDAARPLIVKEWIDAVFATAAQHGAAIPGVRVTSTLKRVSDNGVIEETTPRDQLWAVQTPQVFRKDWLREAYARRGTGLTTDEAQLVEQLGRPVRVVESSPLNIKITTSEDFRMAEKLLEALPKAKELRALHPFADEGHVKW